MVVDPSETTLLVDEVAHLTATPMHGETPLEDRPVDWATSDVLVALVGDDGRVAAVGPGEATITATAEGVQGTARIEVRTVTSLEIEPREVTIDEGDSVQLTAAVTLDDGTEMEDPDIEWSGTFNIVAVDDDGLATGIGPGDGRVTATFEGVADTVDVIVEPLPVATVDVEPEESTVGIGLSVQLTAVLRGEDGEVVVGHALEWATGDAGVAYVDEDGLVTGLASGDAEIIATADGVSGTGRVTVSGTAAPDLHFEQVAGEAASTTLGGVWRGGPVVVVVGQHGTILRSGDGGDTWELAQSQTSHALHGVWGDGTTVVAVGEEGTILRSTDGGASWSRIVGTTSADLADVTGSGSVIVAVGSEGTILRSADGGASWGSIESGTGAGLFGARMSDSVVVAVGSGGTIIRSQDAGVEWTGISSPSSSSLHGLAVDGATYIAVGISGIFRSDDAGATWATLAGGTFPRYAVAIDGDTIMWTGHNNWSYSLASRSTDGGSTWEDVDTGTGTRAPLHAIAGDLSFTVGVGGIVIRSSDAGLSWERVHGARENLAAVWGDGEEIVAVGSSGAIRRSIDGGVNWSDVSSGTSRYLSGVWGVGSTVVAVGEEGTILRSENRGVTWATVSSPTSRDLRAVWGEGSTFHAVGTYAILRSTDGGLTWQARPLPAEDQYLAVWGRDGTVIAVGHRPQSAPQTPWGTIVRSTDKGDTWETVQLGGPVLHGIVGSGIVRVAVGNWWFTRSTDDFETRQAISVPSDPFAIAARGGAMMTVGRYGPILRSLDSGLTWHAQNISSEYHHLRAIWMIDADHAIAVGRSGVILRGSR